MVENGELRKRIRCPRCDSHELWFNAEGLPSICVVCFHVIKREEVTKRDRWSWLAVRVGVGIVVIAGLAVGAAAGYETFRVKKPAPVKLSYHDTSAAVDPDLAGRADVMYGDKPWYKGFTDRPESCALMPSNTTPENDVESDGGHAYITDAQTRGDDYSLFYTDGFRSWVYSSSEIECRRAVSRWIWHHTIDAAN